MSDEFKLEDIKALIAKLSAAVSKCRSQPTYRRAERVYILQQRLWCTLFACSVTNVFPISQKLLTTVEKLMKKSFGVISWVEVPVGKQTKAQKLATANLQKKLRHIQLMREFMAILKDYGVRVVVARMQVELQERA